MLKMIFIGVMVGLQKRTKFFRYIIAYVGNFFKACINIFMYALNIMNLRYSVLIHKSKFYIKNGINSINILKKCDRIFKSQRPHQ